MERLVLGFILYLYYITNEIQGKIDVAFLSDSSEQQLITDDSEITNEFLSHFGKDEDGAEAYRQSYGADDLDHDDGVMTAFTLKEWIQLDYEIYTNLTDAIQNLVTRQGIKAELLDPPIQEYIADYEEVSESLSQITHIRKRDSRVNVISWNMLAIYRLVRRLCLYLPDILVNPEATFQDTIHQIKNAHLNIEGPTEKDYEVSMLAIVNVHFIHDLKASDIASGYVKGKDLGIILHAYHCYEIGNEAISRRLFTTGIEWLEYALTLTAEGDSSIDLAIVQDSLEDSVQYHDEEFVNAVGYEPNFFTQPLSVERDAEKRQTQKQNLYEEFKTKLEPEHSEINYWGVCSGKPHQTKSVRSQLFCWYESRVHAWYRIGPLKAEFLSLTPIEVAQYYEVISDRVAEALKEEASLKLEKSASLSENGLKSRVNSIVRISSGAWLNNDSRDEAHLIRVVESITGLNASARGERNEDLHVSAYSPGGHFLPHMDGRSLEEVEEAHRIATFMFYLSDVPQGGETAFVQAGVGATPIKRSALFWYNAYSDGEVDELTWHGACPVLYGEKWVANKWIVQEHQKSNQQQCHLQRKTPVNILVNGKAGEHTK